MRRPFVIFCAIRRDGRVGAHRRESTLGMPTVVRSTLRRIRQSGLADQGGLFLLVSVTGVNAANLAFHVVISRILGPSSYGALGALLGLLVVLQVPVGAIQVAITREVVEQGTAAEGHEVRVL